MKIAGFRRLALLALVAVVVPACHGGGGKGNPGFKKGGSGGGGGAVALLINATYVDYDPGEDGSEASNLEVTIPFLGYDMATFTDVTASGFAAATSGASSLVIPELENGDLNADLDVSARNVIRDFVQGGGTLVGFLSSTEFLLLVNAVFGYSIDSPDSLGTGAITGAAAGTPFEGGPASIPYNDDTSTMDPASLPPGALAIYVDDVSGEPTVVLIPFGSGHIVIMGYDWFDGAPFGVQDGGWNDVLDRALQLSGGK